MTEREEFTSPPWICGFDPGVVETFASQEVLLSPLSCPFLSPLPSLPPPLSAASLTTSSSPGLNQTAGKGRVFWRPWLPLSLDLGAGTREAGLGCAISRPFLQEGHRTKGLRLTSAWPVVAQHLVSLETLRVGPTLLGPCSKPEVAQKTSRPSKPVHKRPLHLSHLLYLG